MRSGFKSASNAFGVLTLLAGCGAVHSNPASYTEAICAGKDLHSVWQGGGSVLDLSGGGQGDIQFLFQFQGGEICLTSAQLKGRQCDGVLVFYDPTYVAGTGSGVAPDCRQFETVWRFAKTATTLTICDVNTSQCQSFQ